MKRRPFSASFHIVRAACVCVCECGERVGRGGGVKEQHLLCTKLEEDQRTLASPTTTLMESRRAHKKAA